MKSLRAERVKISKGAIGNKVRKHRTFSKEFKKAAIEKLLDPNGPGATKLSEELDLYQSTLYAWKKKYANSQLMTKSKKWTPEQKLEAIMKTYSMSEEELGNYLRSNGLFQTDLEQFKKESLSGFHSKGRPALDPEVHSLRKENKEMERDIRRKDKALAEYSARVILLKKSHEIWGTNEDDE